MLAILLGCGRGAPPLPVVKSDGFSPIVRKQINDALQAAGKPDAHGEAAGQLGMILQVYKMERDALDCYERAKILNPSAYQWWHLSAFLQSRKKNYKEAIIGYTEALRLEPRNDTARLLLAELLINSSRMPEARKLLLDLLNSPGKIARARLRLGQIHAKDGNYTAAMEEYQKALARAPRYGEVHFALAEAYRNKGDLDRSNQQLALFRRWEGNAPTAPDPLLDAVDRLDIGPTGYARRGARLVSAGRLRLAETELVKALEGDPNHLAAHVNLIIVEERIGKPDKADQYYNQAVQLDPNSARLHAVYASVLRGRGMTAQAIPLFEKALALEPEDLVSQIRFGEMLAGMGKVAEAESHFRAALSQDPEHKNANRDLGVLLSKKNQCKEAIPLLEKAIELEGPAGVEGLYALAGCHRKIGNKEQAAEVLRMARVRVDIGRGTEEQRKAIDRDLSSLDLGKF